MEYLILRRCMCLYKYMGETILFSLQLGFFRLFNITVILYLLLTCLYFVVIRTPVLIGGIRED